MSTLKQKIFIKDEYTDRSFFREYNIPVPVFFAIPTLAFHVRVTKTEETHNFIQEAILYLKRNGEPKDKIADMLCLDQRLVDVVIENSKKNENTESDSDDAVTETNEISDDFFIFYNLISKEFISGYAYSNMFYDNSYEIGDSSLDWKNQCYYFKKDLGASYSQRIHLINNTPDIFNSVVKPSPENIVRCYKDEKTFDATMYKSPSYMDEVYPVWLVVGYSVTEFNNNEYSVLNPFRSKVSYSTYLNNLVLNCAKDPSSLNDLRDYREMTENRLVREQNLHMNIRNDREKQAYDKLQSKYMNAGFFKGKIEEQMVKMQAAYDRISKHEQAGDKRINVDNAVREFFDCANNVLEQLLIHTYEPYITSLPKELKKDNFFEAIGREKQYIGQKVVVKDFFDKLPATNMLGDLWNKCDPQKVANTIRNENILRPWSFKPGLYDLFAINVIAYKYFPNSEFGRIVTNEVQNLHETIDTVCQSRQRVKHTYGKEEIHSINDYITCIYQIIDIAFNVSEASATSADVNLEDDDGDYSGFIGSYSEIDSMPESLRASCNQLLRDIYDTSLEYYSDCVIAFENISKVILDFCMRKINSLSDLTRCMNQIPDDEDEAKLFLMEKLERCGIDASFDNISISVRYAKKCLYNNYKFKKASTLIMFAPMLLAVVDYMAFLTLFEKLGSGYFSDAIDSVGERGHDNQTTDWQHIKIINDKFVEYCKTVTLFDREEL